MLRLNFTDESTNLLVDYFEYFDSRKITEILVFNIDLSKNQKDCSKLVDWYSEEVKANYSELNQKVDIIQENLTDVRPHINILYASVWSSLYVR